MDTYQRVARRALAEHRAIAERLQTDPKPVLDYALNNLAGWLADPLPDWLVRSQPDWLVEWERLLTGPLDTLIASLISDTEAGARLRSTSPFLGLLTLQERIEVLHRVDPEMAQILEALEASRNPRTVASEKSVGQQ